MSNQSELDRIQSSAKWYKEGQLDFDKRLIGYRFLSLKPFFVGTSALELGSAEGEMTALIRKEFEHVTSVDGAKELLDIMPDWTNVQKVHSLFEDFDTPVRYGTIFMEHILEHVDDPVSLLRRVSNWMAPDGRVLIGVPNALSIHRLVAVKMGLLSSPYELNDRDHILGHRRVYDLESLTSDISDAGLIPENVGGVFFKPLSNAQMEKNWTDEMINGFFDLGKDFPDRCAELFAVCRKP
jgi:2-polyprenyl-3-methyl-5-hydroxy-6-metoxy-1,4-benzoquinol methylase